MKKLAEILSFAQSLQSLFFVPEAIATRSFRFKVLFFKTVNMFNLYERRSGVMTRSLHPGLKPEVKSPLHQSHLN